MQTYSNLHLTESLGQAEEKKNQNQILCMWKKLYHFPSILSSWSFFIVCVMFVIQRISFRSIVFRFLILARSFARSFFVCLFHFKK